MILKDDSMWLYHQFVFGEAHSNKIISPSHDFKLQPLTISYWLISDGKVTIRSSTPMRIEDTAPLHSTLRPMHGLVKSSHSLGKGEQWMNTSWDRTKSRNLCNITWHKYCIRLESPRLEGINSYVVVTISPYFSISGSQPHLALFWLHGLGGSHHGGFKCSFMLHNFQYNGF